MSDLALPPIHRSIVVSWDPDAAFRRFTAEFATWWPSRTHSIGENRIKRIVFDRNGFLYHGRVRAVADGAREGGLEF